MKLTKIYSLLILIACALFNTGCLEEEDAFDDDFAKKTDVDYAAFALPALLDNDQTCFNLIYPIEVRTNTGTLIRVLNKTALNKLIEEQSTSFHINDIALPFKILQNNIIVNIDSTEAYNTLALDCNLISIPLILNKLTQTCFGIQFPIRIKKNSLTETSDVSVINTNEELKDFISLNEFFAIEYPIGIFDFNQKSIISNHDFDLFKVSKECLATLCNSTEVNLDCTENANNSYSFVAKLSNVARDISFLEESVTYSWFLNDELQNEFKTKNATFILAENSIFQVCVRANLPYCSENKGVCSLAIDTTTNNCADISFTQEVEPQNSNAYNFKVPEDISRNYQSFEWKVDNITENTTGNILFYNFAGFNPGIYLVSVTGVGGECTTNNDIFSTEIVVSQ